MDIGNTLVNSLIVSGLILVAAMIFGIKGEKPPAANSRPPSRRSKRRTAVASQIKARPEVRVGAAGGR